MPIFQVCGWKWIILKTLGRVGVGLATAAIGFGAQAGPAPRPQNFGSPLPAPSSFLLVVTGLAGVVGWNLWRSRSRAQQNSRD
jgi:hypothetical protein